MALFSCVMAFAVNITSRSELQSFLEADGTNSGVIAANLDLTAEGAHFLVAGTKELTINEGVTLSLKSAYADKEEEQPNGYDGHGFCFYVPAGANLTIKGNGTIATDRSVFYVAEGGELTIGESSKVSQLKITTSEGRVKNRVVVCRGNANVYNADVIARSGIFWNAGTSWVKIDGGTYYGKSSNTDGTASKSGLVEPLTNQHTYAVNAQGTIILKNATIKGVHGGICPADNGRLDVDNCSIMVSPDFADYAGAASYHAIYGATYGISTIRNSKFYSKGGYAAYISNNDTKTTFALCYIYENCYFAGGNAAKSYPQVAKKCADCEEILFPVEIDQSSEWYTVARTGGNMPLPSNVEYRVENTVIDGITYKVRTVSTIPAENQEELAPTTDPTIPWQASTTWAGGDVPTEESSVNIPEGKIVVVDKNNAEKTAEANQVNLQGEGASLTVQEGTTLNITNNINIAAGAKLVVDAGAVVTVGNGGVIAASEDAIEVKTQEGKTGTFMIAPGVKENTHPMAKVQLVSKAKYIPAENKYVWQRFGIPAYMAGMTKANVEYDHVANPTAWMKIEHENWSDFEDTDEFKPFTCYGLTTTATTEGAVYTFTCPLMGNGNAELDLADNWNYYANSYTAPINIRQLLKDFNETYPSVSATVYLYRAYDNWWYEINKGAYVFGVDENDQPLPEQIDPMQAFIFQRKNDGDNPVINYVSQIWNPIMVTPSSAPARDRKSYNKAMIEIATADGTKDAIRLIEDDQFSSAFDNSYDAAKYMNENSFNLFAEVNDEKMGTIASDNLDGTMISMTTKGQTSFTMTISHVSGMNYAVRDMLTGTEIDMVEGATYMFSVPADAKVEGRFQIIEKANAPTAIDNIEATAAVKGIYTITGQFVGNDYHSLPNGIYVVDGKKIVK